MNDRRSVRRWSVNREAQLQVQDRENVFPCIVEDLSTNGMRISLGKNLFTEVFSNINIALGNALSFNAGTHVAWQDNQESRNTFGLFFNNIDEIAKNRIQHYINNNFTDQIAQHNKEQWWKGL